MSVPIADAVVHLAGQEVSRRVSVQVDPMATVMTSLVEVFGFLAHRTPEALRRSMTSAARAVPIRLLLELTGVASAHCPDFVIGHRGTGLSLPDRSFEEGLEQVRATPTAELEAQLASFAGVPPLAGRWEREPDRVLSDYCTALDRYWRDVVQPHYPHLEQRLRREAERLEVGFEQYSVRTVANLLHPRLRVDQDALVLRTPNTRVSAPWTPDHVVIRPMVAAAPTFFTNIGFADVPPVRVAHFSSSPPALRPGWFVKDEPQRGLNSLSMLIGRSRAHILDSLLRRPGTTTDLAAEFGLSPATVSHHLKALELAGVLEHRRRGAGVYYRLNDRGRTLANL